MLIFYQIMFSGSNSLRDIQKREKRRATLKFKPLVARNVTNKDSQFIGDCLWIFPWKQTRNQKSQTKLHENILLFLFRSRFFQKFVSFSMPKPKTKKHTQNADETAHEICVIKIARVKYNLVWDWPNKN